MADNHDAKDAETSAIQRQGPGSLKPPSPRVLSGCGCLASAALLFAFINLAFAFSLSSQDNQSVKIDLGSIVLFVGAIYALIIVADMKQLHRKITPQEIWSNARDSSYRSLSTEHAFRALGCYLPLSVLVVFFYNVAYIKDEAQAMTSLVVGAPAFLGVLLLFWRNRWEELRFQQVQDARDRLANSFFGELRGPAADGEGATEAGPLFEGSFFLYLRPFATTDSIKAVSLDSLTSGGVDLEVRLADALALWGPLVALGRPGEARGAGRNEVTEKEWKRVIELAFESADSIFIVPGHQEGIVWEMRLLVEKRLLDRVIFIKPPEAQSFDEDWWGTVRRAMQAEGLASPVGMARNRGAFFVLKPEGEIHTVVEFGRSAGFKQLRRVLRRLLRDVEKRRG